MARVWTVAATIVLAAIGAACGEPAAPTVTASATTAAAVETPTFATEVAPIIHANCAPCHRPGGSGPFSLLSYDDVSRRARQIAEVTATGFMPPWLPEAGYGEFIGERRLSPAELTTLTGWVEAGTPEGDAEQTPAPPSFPDDWELGEPDLVVRLPSPYTLPAEGVDVFRNLIMPIDVPETRWVKTVELRPGNPQYVHHAIMAVDDTTASRRREADETDQAGEPGFGGMDMGQAFMPDGHLMGWTPGMAPNPGTEGSAWRLEPGTDFVLQLHMVPSGRPESLEPAAGFYFADAPPEAPPLHLVRLDGDHLLDIPPGEANFVVTDEVELPTDVEVLAVYPHAHFLARAVETKATLPDGSERWLLRIDDWDFNWQDVYRVAEPYTLPKGTIVSMRMVFDNSADNPRNPSNPPRRVRAGNQSYDEMAHVQLQVRSRSVDDLLALREALYRHALTTQPDDAWNYYALGNALRDQDRLAEAAAQYEAGIAVDPAYAPLRNNLGAIRQAEGRPGEAVQEFSEAIRADPSFVDAHFNLGNVLTSLGRHDEAVTRLREALRLEPRHAAAHSTLGFALQEQGALDDAVGHYREALALRPASAEAHNNLGSALARSGELQEAIGLFQRALAIEPSYAQARDNLELALEIAAELGPDAR